MTAEKIAEPPVWTSYTWWLGLVPVISGVVGFFLHKQIDLSPIAAAIALVGSSVAAGIIAMAHAFRHRSVLQAETSRMELGLRYPYPADTSDTYATQALLLAELHAELNRINEALTSTPPAAKKSTAARKTASGTRR